MPVPAIVGSPTSGIGGASQTITPGAGLSIVAVVTEAQNLPTANSTQINHASSGWDCLVGTKGGAGYSGSGLYAYVFSRVTTNGETITTGDSGVVNGYQALTVSGYAASSPIEDVTYGAGGFSGFGGIGFGAGVSPDTSGPNRLIICFAFPRRDSNTPYAGTFSSSLGLTNVGTLTSVGSALGSGAALIGCYGDCVSAGDWSADGSNDLIFSLVDAIEVTLAIAPSTTTHTAAASLSGTGSLAASATRTTLGAAALSGAGSLAASATRSAVVAAALTGTGELTAAATRTTFGAAALTGVGTLTATAAGDAEARRRLFAAAPMLTGSPMRSAIDFTK